MADYLNFFIYQYGGHKTIYDHENAQLMLEHVGLGSVQRSSYREDLVGPMRSVGGTPSTCRP